jgi:AcrR family transcriptional regulator
VHVEDIAAVAGVSPRTYNNYFASKQEAICSITTTSRTAIWTATGSRPPNW